MEMWSNESCTDGFILLGIFSHSPADLALFSVVMVVFSVALCGNVLLLALISIDPRLHTPMYFFLSQLSLMDLMLVCTIVPKMAASFLSDMEAPGEPLVSGNSPSAHSGPISPWSSYQSPHPTPRELLPYLPVGSLAQRVQNDQLFSFLFWLSFCFHNSSEMCLPAKLLGTFSGGWCPGRRDWITQLRRDRSRRAGKTQQGKEEGMRKERKLKTGKIPKKAGKSKEGDQEKKKGTEKNTN